MTETYFDIVNPTYCDILANITISQFKTLCNSVEQETENDEITDTHLQQHSLLVKYCKYMKKNNYYKQQTYKHSKNKTVGRVFVEGNGLQRIWGMVRGVLCDGLLLDFDMINAHPTILQYICKTNNIMCVNLDGYINNRKQILQEFVNCDNLTTNDAKMLFITSLNYDKQITTVKIKNKQCKLKYKFFLEFDKEIKQIHIKLSQIFKTEYEYYSNEKLNPYGKFINNMMCKYENEILDIAVDTLLNECNLQVCVPMFDGCMIKNNVNININDVIEKLNGSSSIYNIKWSNKKHNIDLKIHLDNLKTECDIFSFDGENDKELCDFVIDNILDKKIYNCNNEIWLYNNRIWTNVNIEKQLIPILSKNDLILQGNPVKNLKELKDIAKMIELHAPINNEFDTLLHEDTIQKLCYNNGYYCFKTNSFIEYNNDNIPFTTHIINRDYKPLEYDVNDINIKFILDTILHPIFDIDKNNSVETNENNTANMWFFLNKISRMLAGHIVDKKWLLFLGNRNSGKGVIQEILQNAFTKYIGSFNSSCLINKPSMGEDSKMSAWMLDFRFTRIMFGNEINMSNKQKISGILIKQLVSGGDTITARRNNKDAITVKIQSSIILNANDIPECDPADAMETCEMLNMPIKFMDDDEYKRLTEIEKKMYKRGVKNLEIKNYCKTDKYIYAFESILFYAYTKETSMPLSHSMLNDDNMDEMNDDKKFIDLLEFGNGKEYMLFNSDIDDLKQNYNINISKLKLGNLLLTAGCKKFRNVCGRGFLGCKLKN
tara:strand:+ start:91 stop:2409 length:2319 start_codon:yes stop_codon:yes gene_type:complete